MTFDFFDPAAIALEAVSQGLLVEPEAEFLVIRSEPPDSGVLTPISADNMAYDIPDGDEAQTIGVQPDIMFLFDDPAHFGDVDGDGVEDEPIEINVRRLKPYEPVYDGGGGGGGGGGSTGGGGGTIGPPATPTTTHTQDCSTDDGAAVQVAKHVMGALPPGVQGPPNPVQTPAGNDWNTVELGAVIVRNADGSFGALNDKIYSNDLEGITALPNGAGAAVQGFWHNHPASAGSTAFDIAVNRYPSPGDWVSLQSIARQTGANSNPSIWLTDNAGVTREFKLSERGEFTNPSREEVLAGKGLEGKERSQSCG